MMTISTADLRTFYVSDDVARALTGQLTGKHYRVELHALAGRVFYVEADTVDDAQRKVVQCVRRERPNIATGATITLAG
jgi:hypothetical protein